MEKKFVVTIGLGNDKGAYSQQKKKKIKTWNSTRLKIEENAPRTQMYKKELCINIQCEIEAVPYEQLRDTQPGESSAAMRERVLRARAIQTERFKQSKLAHCNAMMNSKMVRQYCALDDECDKLLELSMTKLGLSARL